MARLQTLASERLDGGGSCGRCRVKRAFPAITCDRTGPAHSDHNEYQPSSL